MKSFRTLIAAAAAVAVAVGLVGCAAATTTAAAHTVTIPAGQLGGAFTADSTANAEQVLAASGIATVSGEKSASAVVGVTGTVRMTFTAAQVRAMTLEAADHGGISGATLDQTANLPANYPPFAYLLAAWVKAVKTPGAAAMRKAMGTADWSEQTWSDAPKIVFPTIALPLFTADVTASLPAAARASSGLGSSAGSTGVGAVRAAAFIRTAAAAGVFSSACSSVSGFIQNVLNSVFTALQFDTSSSSGIGGTIKTIWNIGVGLAQQAIQGLASVITGPVLSAIKTIAGTAAVVAQIVSYVKPWSVSVVADPSSVNAGDGGSFTASVDTGTGGADYPSTVKDCASALGVTLPALTAANAKATWDLSGAISTSDDTSVSLDDHGKGTISFTSSKNATGAECDGAGQADRDGTARITVTRPDTDGVKQLATSVLTNGLGVAGSIIGPVISSILSPIFDQVLSAISSLTTVSGAGTVAVVEPASGSGSGCDNGGSAGSTPQPSKSEAAACMVGTWTTTAGSIQVPSTIERGMVGATFTITAQGKFTEDFNGSTPLVVDGASAAYGGVQVQTITIPAAGATAGTLLESSVDSSTITLGGKPLGGVLFHDAVASPVGKWTCSGNSLSLSFTTAIETESFDLTRAAG